MTLQINRVTEFLDQLLTLIDESDAPIEATQACKYAYLRWLVSGADSYETALQLLVVDFEVSKRILGQRWCIDVH